MNDTFNHRKTLPQRGVLHASNDSAYCRNNTALRTTALPPHVPALAKPLALCNAQRRHRLAIICKRFGVFIRLSGATKRAPDFFKKITLRFYFVFTSFLLRFSAKFFSSVKLILFVFPTRCDWVFPHLQMTFSQSHRQIGGWLRGLRQRVANPPGKKLPRRFKSCSTCLFVPWWDEHSKSTFRSLLCQ